jgi:hypothetical protein
MRRRRAERWGSVAAVLLDPDQYDEIRTRTASVIGDRGRPFHWKDEGVEKRRAMIRLLGDLDVGVFATIHHPVPPSRQRQARRAALTDLVMRLDKEGVDELGRVKALSAASFEILGGPPRADTTPGPGGRAKRRRSCRPTWW